MPRLAGQLPGYIKTQLQAFIEHRRLNPVMGNVAHVLSPAMVDALVHSGGRARGVATVRRSVTDQGLQELHA